MSEKNIGVFIDVSSIHKNIRQLYNSKLDYTLYLDRIKEMGNISRCFAYGTQIDNEAKKFIDCLEIIGIETKYIQAKVIKGGKIYRIDRTPQMVIDIVRLIPKLDIVVIGSSNSVILPVIPYIRDQGCQAIIFSCNIPKDLKEACTKWIEINDEYLENRDYRKEEDIEELIDEESLSKSD